MYRMYTPLEKSTTSHFIEQAIAGLSKSYLNLTEVTLKVAVPEFQIINSVADKGRFQLTHPVDLNILVPIENLPLSAKDIVRTRSNPL